MSWHKFIWITHVCRKFKEGNKTAGKKTKLKSINPSINQLIRLLNCKPCTFSTQRLLCMKKTWARSKVACRTETWHADVSFSCAVWLQHNHLFFSLDISLNEKMATTTRILADSLCFAFHWHTHRIPIRLSTCLLFLPRLKNVSFSCFNGVFNWFLFGIEMISNHIHTKKT